MPNLGPEQAVATTLGRDFLKVIFGYDALKKSYGKWALPAFTDYLGSFGVSRALFVSMLFVALLNVLSLQVPDLTNYALEWVVGTSPIWLPFGLMVGAWKVWIWYVRALYLSKQKNIVLEMKIPRDITRSPRAMELALTNLWTSSGETTIFHRWWRGGVRPFYSLELCSFGGIVHFYIWTHASNKNVVEALIYAQYPEVELVEVEDYASKFQFDRSKHMMFATEHQLDPRNSAYPLKTYIDYELDKDPKEEFKVDPLSYVLEFLSSIKPQEQIWMQIIFTLNKDKRAVPGKIFQTEPLWEAMIREEVEKIRKRTSEQVDPETGRVKIGFPRPTFSEQEQMKAMERQLGKYPFSVGIRALYIAEKAYWHTPNYVGMRWIWRPFNNPGYLNQLKPTRGHNILDYPWQDFNRIRFFTIARRYLDAFRRRSFFYAPWITPYQIMTTEVLASLWHPPSRSTTAPGILRTPATKAEPPPNLPM